MYHMSHQALPFHTSASTQDLERLIAATVVPGGRIWQQISQKEWGADAGHSAAGGGEREWEPL